MDCKLLNSPYFLIYTFEIKFKNNYSKFILLIQLKSIIVTTYNIAFGNMVAAGSNNEHWFVIGLLFRLDKHR